MSITFNEEDHTYTHTADYGPGTTISMNLPSVTTILKDVGVAQDFGAIPKVDMDWYGDRGNKIHKACHLWNIGDLDEETVHEDIRGYLEGYKKFKKTFKYVTAYSELVVHDLILGFAGTLDNAGTYYPHGRKRKMVGDIKSGAPHKSHGVQLAAYRRGLYKMEGIHPRDCDLIGIYVKKDGTFKIEDYTGDAHYYDTVFRSAITIYNAKRRLNG